MQNPLQFPFQFSPILANLPFDLSSLHHHHHTNNHGLSPGSNPSALLTINPLHSNNSSSSVHSSTSDSSDLHAHSTHVNSLSPSNKSPSPHHHHHHHHSHPHLDAATAAAMSRLLFPQSLLAHSLCGFSPPEETISAKDKYSKRASVSSKSFTIDSLLGLNNAAARAVMQGGIMPPHHHQHLRHHNANVPINGVSLPTSISGGTAQSWKKSDVKDQANHRYHPYHPNASLNNNHVANANPSAIHPHGNANGNHQVHSNQAGQIQSTNHQSVPLSTPKPKLSSHNTAPSSTEKSPEASSQSSRRVAKAKRVRTIFTPEQLERLEAEFERQQYMVGPERLYLASSLHLTEAQVKVWFQNRRIKWRKQHLEMQQQRLAAIRSQSEDPEDESGTEFDGSSSPTPTDSSATFANDLSIAQTSPNSSFSPHSSLVSSNQHVREHFVLSQDAHDRESSASPKQLQESFSLPTDRRHSVAVGEFS